jgi:hypothetical protein
MSRLLMARSINEQVNSKSILNESWVFFVNLVLTILIIKHKYYIIKYKSCVAGTSLISSWKSVDMTLHFIHNHWNTYLPSLFFVDFCWIYPDDQTIVHWPISFVVITTSITIWCVNIVMNAIIWTNVLNVIQPSERTNRK